MNPKMEMKKSGGLKERIKAKVAGFLEKTGKKLIELWWVDFAFAVAGTLLLLLVVRLRRHGEEDDDTV